MSHTVLVGEAVAGESAKTRAMLVSLISSVNKSTLDIAELLYKVKSNGYYTAEHSTFKEYTESLEIKSRKAQYLTRIVEVMTQVDLPRAQYEKLGIAKLREITSLDPSLTYKNPVSASETPMKEFIQDFVTNGADMDLDDIKQHVRTLKGFTGSNDIVWKNIPFTRAVLEQTIEPAMELTRANIGSVGKDAEGISQDASEASCVEAWAADYLLDPQHNPMHQALHAEDDDDTEDHECLGCGAEVGHYHGCPSAPQQEGDGDEA